MRAFHWLLVAAVGAAAASGFLLGMSWLAMHLIAGVGVAALVIGRVVWGVLGPTYARFADFAYGPRAVLGHARDIASGRGSRHLGHNPLGAMMVFALLLVLAAIVAAGVVALGGMFKQGPLGAFVSFATGRSILALHQALAVALLAMIALHLGGVAYESWRGGENLVAAMLTGRKRRLPAADRVAVHRSRPAAALLLLVGMGGLATAGAVTLAAIPAAGAPPAELDAGYDGACGSCHFAFSPSLNPGWVWDRILGGLEHHFGLRASVDPTQLVALRAYLDANAAGRWDTLPARMFRARDPAQPLRITATPYWRHIHAAIPARVFALRAVSGRAACGACHQDAASGRFAPQAIAVPDGSG